MPDWTAFGAVTVTLTGLVLLLARATQSALEAAPPQQAESGGVEECGVAEEPGVRERPAGEEPIVDESAPEPREPQPAAPLESVSTFALYLNVAGTQALFLFLVLAGIWLTDVPLRSLGVAVPTATELGVGAVLGVVLFVLNQAGARIGRQFGLGGEDTANRTGAVGDEALREALAPETVSGWLALLFVVLPIVAGFEELLFRGVLIGGFATGFGVPVWLLVVGSSAVFALGHGAQGRVGVVVTGLLGVALAVAFVVTGNLVVVFVAHYLVNSLEFVVCEGVFG